MRESALGAEDVVLKDTFEFGPVRGMHAFGQVLDDAEHMIFTLPGDRMLAVLDLNTRNQFTVPRASAPGPLGIDRKK